MTGTGINLIINPESLAHYIESIKRQFGLDDESAKTYALKLYYALDSKGGNPDNLSPADDIVTVIVGAWLEEENANGKGRSKR